MDATTGLSIRSRHGLGKVKYTGAVFLWAQDEILFGEAGLLKKHADDMIADLFTKPLETQRTRKLLTNLNYHFSEGRYHLALPNKGLRLGAVQISTVGEMSEEDHLGGNL